MKLTKKISAKEVLGNILDIVKDMAIGQIVSCFGAAGTCHSYGRGVSQYGEWTRFLGDFEAQNYISGETIRGAGIHVPEVLEAILLQNLEGKATLDEKKSKKEMTVFTLENPIEFAFNVSLERLEDKENGALNYKFHTSPLTEVKANDNIGHLTKLLGAPKQEEKEAPKKEAKTK